MQVKAVCKYYSGRGLSQQSSRMRPFAARHLAGRTAFFAAGNTRWLSVFLKPTPTCFPGVVRNGGLPYLLVLGSHRVEVLQAGVICVGLVFALSLQRVLLNPAFSSSLGSVVFLRCNAVWETDSHGGLGQWLGKASSGSALLAWICAGVPAFTWGKGALVTDNLGSRSENLLSFRE